MYKMLFTAALTCAALMAHAAPTLTQGASNADARVIVKYKSDSSLLRKDLSSADARHASQAAALAKRVGVALRAGAGVADRTQVVFATGMTSDELAARLAAEPDIEYAVPDGRVRHHAVPNDPLYLTGPPVSGLRGGPVAGQWYLRAPTAELQSTINVETAWDLSANGANVVVAVLDTGIRYDHSDLKTVTAGGTLLPGYDMINDVVSANDGDGRDADASDPGDWVTDAEAFGSGPFYGCPPEDSSWHGTQVSGLIGALTNNGAGMASVGRQNVRVLPVRVLGKCGGFDSDIIAGMLWASGLNVPGAPPNPNPARVLNLSLGGETPCTSALSDAIAKVNAAGVVVVASAGNASIAVGAPANCPGVVAVAGLSHSGTKVGFSSLGPQVAISSPGGNCVNTEDGAPCLYPILTAANTGLTGPINDAGGGSTYTDSFHASRGTSFSSPLVAATAALMLSVQPSLAPIQVVSGLRASARRFPEATGTIGEDGRAVPQCVTPPSVGFPQPYQDECSCTRTTCGAGMLDAGAAVRMAIEGVPPAGNVGTRLVTEFYHPTFDEYFITADPTETTSLASGNAAPWVATGKTFKSWDAPDVNITNVCRFYTSFFRPKSAHYFTNREIDCPGLQARGPWVLEDPNAFYMMPVQSVCPFGTLPLYRVYNNARGGAPNYRYTVDLLVRSEMIAKGWEPDGDGDDGVFACIPQ